MKLHLFYVLIVGFILEKSDAGKKEKVHVKIHVPKIIKHHHHTKLIYVHKKDDKKEHKEEDHGHGKKHVVVIHKHEHSHKHKHDHGHKHGHKHSHDHKGKHDHKHSHKGEHKHQHEQKKKPKKEEHHGGYDFGHGHGGGYDLGLDLGHGGHEEHGFSGALDHSYDGDYDEGYDGGYESFPTKSSHNYKVKEYYPADYTTDGYHRRFKHASHAYPEQSYYHNNKYAQLADAYQADNEKYFPNTYPVGQEEYESSAEEGLGADGVKGADDEGVISGSYHLPSEK